MPRFYFDIDDNGDAFRDAEGEILTSFAHAEDRARKILVQLAEDEIPKDGPHRVLSITIRGDTGEELSRLSIIFVTELRNGKISERSRTPLPSPQAKHWRNP